ncbi:alpha/beta fold hydrolase [Streptomyces chiangmaiensis]|uniref:Alpha/beta hydrolase n=1 Tax=Streptomyces chiangmaiensis TaxID=766497 RepID=A0ABU7FPJ4_9ACTN|nr:alpha/beta hydrolase [Streptomyces chiangmaiensis]MED7825871.1 alpha/beta hydrolase [Streptomyces chiangmaiensis]
MSTYRRTAVPLADGELTVGIWGSGRRAVLAVHGVTSSHRAWQLVAERLPADTLLIAPDLRGRGDSAALPGPYGMARHADDCVAALDALGYAEVVVAGHSMGGFVALVLADRHPERVRRLVLVDGGPPLPLPPGDTPEERLSAVIGPAAARLTMRFRDRDAYREHWRAHPAFAEWTPAVEAYVDYDLTGEPGDLRSKASADAVRDDSVDLYTGGAAAGAWSRLRHEALFLRAELGMLGALPALYQDPAPIAARMPVRTIEDSNHYTILLGPHGADSVAETL